MGGFGKAYMYLTWAAGWILVMVFGLLSAIILLGMSVSAESSDAGLMRGLGILFLGAGLLGIYVTYLNFRRRKAT
ncbi:MAG: hypothetical protein ACUVT7_09790 [Thermoplasmata archaeon]